jgi:alpha/beta hydrolase family protein
LKRILLGTLVALWLPCAAEARVVRFVVEHREPFAGGAAWGQVGPYERLVGTAYVEVDPRDPLNAIIVDLDKAPKNARGMVEFSTPFFILRPVDMARGNGKIYYTVNNRGNDALFTARTVADIGRNDFALRLGYIIVDAGWQGDLAASSSRLGATLPVATQPDGSPIVGLMRVEFSDRNMPAAGTFTLNLKGSAAFRPYEAADLNTGHATFTVRDSVDGAPTRIAGDRWAFGRCPTGKQGIESSSTDICYFDRFQADKIYELVYAARNPIVMGLGHAATRDVASFLRYEARDQAGNPNPLAGGSGGAAIRRVYATGASQTGGYLRDFIYLGFNEDEAHRRVFDGIIPTIAGTDRVFINVRFADPNVYSGQDDRHDYLQNSYPPFTYAVTTDAASGSRDGIMKRPATDPYLFQVDSATEFWQLRASLNIVDANARPVSIPPNVRLYFVSSTSHGFGIGGLLAATPGRNDRCANPSPGGAGDLARPLLQAMDAWVDQGIEPPESNYPRLDDGTLVTIEEARQAFPAIPGIVFPRSPNPLRLLEFGPEFGRYGGVMTLQPPLQGAAYPVMVPKADRDGFDIAGIRTVQVRAPLGTTTGWNVRTAEARVSDLCGLSGSYLPFATTTAERVAAGDPRKSLEERYGNHAGFVEAVAKAARDLVKARFLHAEDAERYVAAARASNVLK